jgi:hypothetical protein
MPIIPREEYNYCLDRDLAVAVIARVPFIGVDYSNTDKETAIKILKSIPRDTKRELWYFRIDENGYALFEKYLANGEHKTKRFKAMELMDGDGDAETNTWEHIDEAIIGDKVILFDSPEVEWEEGIISSIEKAAKCGCTIMILDDMLDLEIEEFPTAIESRLSKYGIIGKLPPPSADELAFYLKLFLKKNNWKHPTKNKNIPIELTDADIQKIASLLTEIKANIIQANKTLSLLIADCLIDSGEKVDNSIIADLEEMVKVMKEKAGG